MKPRIGIIPGDRGGIRPELIAPPVAALLAASAPMDGATPPALKYGYQIPKGDNVRKRHIPRFRDIRITATQSTARPASRARSIM